MQIQMKRYQDGGKILGFILDNYPAIADRFNDAVVRGIDLNLLVLLDDDQVYGHSFIPHYADYWNEVASFCSRLGFPGLMTTVPGFTPETSPLFVASGSSLRMFSFTASELPSYIPPKTFVPKFLSELTFGEMSVGGDDVLKRLSVQVANTIISKIVLGFDEASSAPPISFASNVCLINTAAVAPDLVLMLMNAHVVALNTLDKVDIVGLEGPLVDSTTSELEGKLGSMISDENITTLYAVIALVVPVIGASGYLYKKLQSTATRQKIRELISLTEVRYPSLYARRAEIGVATYRV